jgi:uncharacterized protein
MNKDLLSLKDTILQNFTCQSCGNCCRREGGYVYVTNNEMEKIAKYKQVTMFEFKQKHVLKQHGWNILSSPTFKTECFLEPGNNNCLIYDARPRYCRRYPDCEDVWQTEESVKEELEFCPGLRASVETVY